MVLKSKIAHLKMMFTITQSVIVVIESRGLACGQWPIIFFLLASDFKIVLREIFI